jgi:hypothetical protein
MLLRSCLYAGLAVTLALRPLNVHGQERDVTITLYQADLGLVREVRPLQLEKGRAEVEFLDVPARIDPTSVYFLSLTAPQAVRIIEQNYEYDLVDAAKLLDKHIDHEVMLETKDGTIYTGILLSSSSRESILKDELGRVKIITRSNIENVSFPRPIANLITRPTLLWTIDNSRAGKHDAEIGYLTSGIHWHAEYVGISSDDDTRLDLGGWVSIDNRSGASYPDARLKLVAGDVNRIMPPRFRKGAQTMMVEAAPPTFEEKSFYEYHMYTLQGRTTVANNQVKQISLFAPAAVAVGKEYSYDSQVNARKVGVHLVFDNNREAGLGIPLPQGKIRVYKRDTDQSLVFIGEDHLDHTPKNETVRIFSGFAFDLVAERTQKERQTLGKTSWEESWEIELRNSKDKDVMVMVIEPLRHDWEIISHSHAYEMKDANTLTFALRISGNNRAVVSYTVRYRRN